MRADRHDEIDDVEGAVMMSHGTGWRRNLNAKNKPIGNKNKLKRGEESVKG